MSAELALRDSAERVLAQMRAAGFEHAQVTATRTELHEVNVNHDEPSLMRSTRAQKLAAVGIVDGRRASTELSDFDDEVVGRRVQALFADAQRSPRDDANAVSAGQQARIVQGPPQADVGLLADKAGELLDFRARETPSMMLEEAAVSHVSVRSHTLTSGGSDLGCDVAWYEMVAMGTAREGSRVSSFNYTGGTCHDLAGRPAPALFGLGAMFRDTERQIHTRPLDARFRGDAVLMPNAVADLLAWLLGQVGDTQLIAGTSLYRDRVGEAIASPLLEVRSRFDAPGVAAISGDGFAAPPVDLVRAGRLATLMPSLYGSRKTGLRHVPVAAAGWEIGAGETPLEAMVGSVAQGALIGRLSMGMPASNGDFSGVIKNSFRIVDGRPERALSETMLTGNVARMLLDVVAVSRERIDAGRLHLPWLRVAGLQFS